MSKIRIKNFGPIKEGYLEDGGWIDIKKVTVFIGNQGSGKSTVAKLISTFVWMEKALTRGDYDKEWFVGKDVLEKYCSYHNIQSYFKFSGETDLTEIEYIGNSYSIKHQNRYLTIKENEKGNYPLPQIMYVPADRNFLSTVDDLKSQRLFSPALSELLAEFRNAKMAMESDLKRPINDADLRYDKFRDILFVKGNDYQVKLTEASSGFQSLAPLYMVSWFLANAIKVALQNIAEKSPEPMSSDESDRFRKAISEILLADNLTDEQKRIGISEVAKKINKNAFINIVEEPEQNLYPSSQWQMLQSLLEFNNMSPGNKLIITTHSPYIINDLSIAIQGKYLKDKIGASAKAPYLLDRMNEVIDEKSLVNAVDVVVYQLDESDGSIRKLQNPEGIPSDKNFLNNMLAEGNRRFDSLLEIEEEI